MCGITVYITKNKYEDDKLKSISYRGPDETNILKSKYLDFNIYYIFHRLAIIDVSNGHQPFIYQSNDRKVILLCNGEIYNYLDIIDRYTLKTKSDCHVILDLYIKFGISQTVNELDGEFAFVIVDFDINSMKVYYCRDRFGIRPLFNYFDESGFYFSSELKGLPFLGLGQQVEPRMINSFSISSRSKLSNVESIPYYEIGKNQILIIDNMYDKIKNSFIKSVKNRLNSEREIGALLSGGLDSSLVCAVASKLLKNEGKRLKTFSIGIETSSPDIQFARKVAEYIDSEHQEIIIPIEEWLNYLNQIPEQIETYDITTIRATTAQYLITKWIKDNTNVKVLLVGDGSDELTAGYKYFYNAPSSMDSHNECIRLLSEIHHYDVLRCDRGISSFGIECRVPFLSHDFVDLYLSINPDLRNPIKNKRIEKEILRKSFENDNILPNEVLFRSKEAFSDGISNQSKSFYEYIQESVESKVSDKGSFPSKEALYYYTLFKKAYPNFNEKLFKGYWLPKWFGNIEEPSARILEV